MEKVVKAFFGVKEIKEDASFELEFSHYLKENLITEERLSVYERFKCSDTKFDSLMRKNTP